MKDFARGYIASGVFNGCRAGTCKIRLLNCIVIQWLQFVLSRAEYWINGSMSALGCLMKGIDILFSLACGGKNEQNERCEICTLQKKYLALCD